MPIRSPLLLVSLSLMMVCSAAAQQPAPEELRQQVEKTERAFAQTMADRDFEAFTAHLAEEAVFFAGQTPLPGKQRVADTWKPYFDEPDAPLAYQVPDLPFEVYIDSFELERIPRLIIKNNSGVNVPGSYIEDVNFYIDNIILKESKASLLYCR